MGLIRQADTLGEYELYCTHTNPYSLAVHTAHHFSVEPAGLVGEAYVQWCLAFCQQWCIGIFIPGKEAPLMAAAHARFLAIGTRVLSVASQPVLKQLDNKAHFYREVNTPQTPPAEWVAIHHFNEYDAAYADLRSRHEKLCVKPAVGVFGIGFSVLDEHLSGAQLLLAGKSYQMNAAEWRQGLAQIDHFKTLLLMEYLDGLEYSVDCLAHQGHLVCAIAREKALGQGRGSNWCSVQIFNKASPP